MMFEHFGLENAARQPSFMKTIGSSRFQDHDTSTKIIGEPCSFVDAPGDVASAMNTPAAHLNAILIKRVCAAAPRQVRRPRGNPIQPSDFQHLAPAI